MLLTEEEARGKWCPFSRKAYKFSQGFESGPFSGACSFNRGNRQNCDCIASSCTSWRLWDSLRGYCGLAGRPTVGGGEIASTPPPSGGI
jgi:hypothetical protein